MNWVKPQHLEVCIILFQLNKTYHVAINEHHHTIIIKTYIYVTIQIIDNEFHLHQIDDGQIIKMDLKMSIIKFLLYGWLNLTWQYVTDNQDMIQNKWWDVKGLEHAFDFIFHIQAMIDKLKTPSSTITWHKLYYCRRTYWSK